MKQSQNTFTASLGPLGVKHTGTFSDRHFNEHPHKYNLFGLSRMFYDYGIENAATRIEDKERDLSDIQTPFIANFSIDDYFMDIGSRNEHPENEVEFFF